MKLTDQQVHDAAKAIWETDGVSVSANPFSWQNKALQDRFCVAARNAAPFLQMRWDDPTSPEIESACGDFLNNENNINRTLRGVSMNSMRNTLARFVDRRNALLIPKPIDPRRKSIISILERKAFISGSAMPSNGDLADYIIAALDEKDRCPECHGPIGDFTKPGCCRGTCIYATE